MTKKAEKKTTAVVEYDKPRLPYHAGIEKKYEVDVAAWRVLTESIFPAAKTPEAIGMALAYCKQRGLDIFKRPVHIVPIWNSALKKMVETVWPGISELRTTASRTREYAGIDECVFGPTISRVFKGRVKRGDKWVDMTVEVTFPEWAQVTVYRRLGAYLAKFVGPKCFWLETYASIGQTDIPNDRWQRASFGQHEKCTEAAALRRAFPEEIGNEYTAEEMEGQRSLDDIGGQVIEAEPEPKGLQAPGPNEANSNSDSADGLAGLEQAGATRDWSPEGAPAASHTPEPGRSEEAEAFGVDVIDPAEPAKWLKGVRWQFKNAPDAAAVKAIVELNINPHESVLLPPDIAKARTAHNEAINRIEKK